MKYKTPVTIRKTAIAAALTLATTPAEQPGSKRRYPA